MSLTLRISGTVHHMIEIFDTMCKKMLSQASFFIFSKFYFFEFLEG